ncbi:MAG: hypothetical protein LBK55_07200 [Azoarcus sp.]|nr:hypothetical protein [Azoarcus sp.]
MKRLFLLNLVASGLMFSLAGCGGGGGGGGGGGSGVAASEASQTGAAFTHKQLAGDATARSVPGTLSASTLASAPAAQKALSSGEGYVRVENNGSVTLRFNGQSLATFTAGKTNLYTKNGVKFAVLSDTKARTGGGTETHYLWFGTLNYTAFGYWAQVSEVSGKKIPGNWDAFFYKSGGLIPSVDSAYAHARYDGGNLGTFTGIAAGLVKYDDKTSADADTAVPLIGKASLTIAGPSNGTLVLDFPNFYKLTGSVNTSTDTTLAVGEITGNFTKFEKKGGNVDLPTVASGYSKNTIKGQLFGKPTGNSTYPRTPTEAAGAWLLSSSTSARNVEVIGSFGVKK